MDFSDQLKDDDDLPLNDNTTNPYLMYQPPFAYSLPSQMLVNGIVLTLCTVLLSHLLFTSQYHFPLSKLNFLLQLLAVLSLLTKQVVELILSCNDLYRTSSTWPFMFEYSAIDIPPVEWDVWRTGAWLALLALVSAFVNLTHIQFLTLLFPSDLEQLLIFTFLGPLAVVGAALTFCDLSSSTSTIKTADSIKNVCNSTLTLLFTAGLIIWGFIINKRRAWRTDGGTAAFGLSAIFLAVIGTSVNFLLIKEDRVPWLQAVEWAIVMWQSWLGFWWWVGAGMGIGEVEDRKARHRKKKRNFKKRTVETEIESTFISPVESNNSNLRIRRRGRPHQNTVNNNNNNNNSSSNDSPEGSTEQSQTFKFSPKNLINYLYNNLRRAHNAAARIQAREHKKKREENERRWGPGEFALGNINPIRQSSQLSSLNEDDPPLNESNNQRSFFSWTERFRRRQLNQW